jgi:MFS family permease
MVAAVRWVDRFGKGVRTAPRDALVADSISARQRGLAFGFHRAADTLGAVLGLLIALGIVASAQAGAVALGADTFRTVVLVSLVPAVLSVLALTIGAREVRPSGSRELPRFALRALGKPFLLFLLISGLFDLGNSSDAFLVLRAQERGLSVTNILAMLASFNLVYALVSTPAGRLSDRLGRQALIVGGWLVYAAIYLGFALAQTGWQVWALYMLYGLHYALALGASKALVADLVPEDQRGAAYGTYHAVLGLLDLPASLIAGILWQGIGSWRGFGAPAPFLFGAATALLAALLMALWKPSKAANSRLRNA